MNAIPPLSAPEDNVYPRSIQSGIPKLGNTPRGWRRFKLRDLLRPVERPAILRDNETYQLVTARRSRGGIVAREILRGDQIRTKTQFFVQAGDFLISNRQISHGACGIVPSSLDGSIVSNEYSAFHTTEALDPRFLNALAHTTYFQQTCFHSSIGVHIEKLVFRVAYWMEWQFDIPPVTEQLRVIALLDTWEEAIQASGRLLNAHLRLRTWLRVNLLTGKKRLNGHTGEWREMRLNQVLYEHGARSSGGETVHSVSVHRGLVNQVEHLGRSFAAKQTAHYNRVLPGDVVYTKSPTGEFPFGIVKQNKLDEPVIVSPLYAVFTPVNRDLGTILDAYFESPIATNNLLHQLVQKGAKNTLAITNNRFLEGKLFLPVDTTEQQDLARIIEVGRNQVLRLQAKIDALQRQKQALMQKLLTGERRLDDRFDRPAFASPSTPTGGAA